MSDRMSPTVTGPRTFVPYRALGAGGGPLPGKFGMPQAAVAPSPDKVPQAAAAHSRGEELLRACAECRAEDALQLLAEGGLELDCTDDVGRTPLMWAAMREPMRGVVEALVNAGARLDAVDNTGDSALILACSLRHKATALLLVARGASLGIVGEHGRTALDHANETRKVRVRSRRAPCACACAPVSRGASS